MVRLLFVGMTLNCSFRISYLYGCRFEQYENDHEIMQVGAYTMAEPKGLEMDAFFCLLQPHGDGLHGIELGSNSRGLQKTIQIFWKIKSGHPYLMLMVQLIIYLCLKIGLQVETTLWDSVVCCF